MFVTGVQTCALPISNLEVRLLRGTAIVEATGVDDMDLNISISTPHTKLAIVRQGLYRLNVVPEDATELIVRKGRVILSDSHTKVKGGNKVVFSATAFSVAKLTKEEKKAAEKSDVDTWSKQRADTLAKANSRITNRMLTTAFSSFGGWDARSRGFGFWFYNSRFGCYTFLPFFYGFGSPYGSSYSTSIYGYGGFGGGYYYPRPGGNPGYWPNGNTGGNTATGGQGGSSGGSSGGGGTTPTAQPSTSPSGGMSQPRMIDPDTGSRMPRKNIELPSRPNNN